MLKNSLTVLSFRDFLLEIGKEAVAKQYKRDRGNLGYFQPKY
ncbi:hypothetical protein ACN4EK_12830 [Pantanalinema rosaneae CENA516]